MHILIIPSWYPRYKGDIGGSFFREQAIALKESGLQVGIIFPQLRSLKEWKSIFTGNHSIEISNDNGIPTYRSHGMAWFPKLPYLTSKLWVLHGLRLYKQYRKEFGTPDIIHAHSILNAGILAWEIYQKHKIPYVITEHSTLFTRETIPLNILRISKNPCNHSSENIAVSQIFAEKLNTKLDLSRKWITIPNIVNQAFYKHTKENRKKQFFSFINVALMNNKKGQENILLALKKIEKTEPNISLILVGDGENYNDLFNLSKKLEIDQKVRFTGLLPRENVLKEMAEADAFILASRHETFGVVVIEALALGKPVIVTKCGGPESIVTEQDGIIVPVDNIDELASAMLYMIHNYKSFDSEKIRNSCIAHYSEEAVTNKLKKVYSKIL